MNIYHVTKEINGRELEYYIAIGKSLFGNIYYVLDCNFEGSLVEITLIYCDGLIKFDIFADDFREFPEYYYEGLGQLAFFGIEEILEQVQDDESLHFFSKTQDFLNFSIIVSSHFLCNLKEILGISLRGD